MKLDNFLRNTWHSGCKTAVEKHCPRTQIATANKAQRVLR